MKTFLPISAIVAILFIFSSVSSSCKKTDVSSLTPKDELVKGKWNINRMQLRIYTGGVFIKDTIIKQTPKPQNFINFDASGSFEYRFNTNVSKNGSYQISGADSIIANTSSEIFKWKMLTLTTEIFTVVNTSSSDANFPGSVVENYLTLVRYK